MSTQDKPGAGGVAGATDDLVDKGVDASQSSIDALIDAAQQVKSARRQEVRLWDNRAAVVAPTAARFVSQAVA